MSTNRLRHRSSLIAAVFAVLLALAWVQDAQAQSINVQNFEPAASPYSIFTVDGSRTLSPLEVSGGIVLNYAKEPLVFQSVSTDERRVIVEDQLAADLLVSLGVIDNLEVGLGLPVYLVNDASLNNNTIEGATLGDARLRGKYALLQDDALPTGVTLYVDLGFPTGDDEAFTSAGQFFARPGLIVDTEVNKFLFAVNLSANLQQEHSFESVEVGSSLLYRAGVEYKIRDHVLVGGELYGSTAFDDLFQEEEAPLEGLLGGKIRTDSGLNFEMGAGGGLVAGYGAPVYRVFGGVRYANFDNDWDKDGILNPADACPRDPEDIDTFEDADGCPDPDNDQDTLLDVDDQCPNDPEDLDNYEDKNGCPDIDNDKDGILDADDQCPDAPEDEDGFEDLNGCPDPDNDQDGVLDVDDNCIDTPGPAENKGCPFGDRDKDGITDNLDKCPDDPEDKDDFEDEDGCPDVDNDKDGIFDNNDKCPNQAGSTKNKGCPDVYVTATEIKILEKIYFDVNKATIKPRSYNILNKVAYILKTSPQVEKIQIQGHTDDQGREVYNLDLSEKRAQAVAGYLIAQGIDPGRLVAKGYGETEPLAEIDGLRGRSLRDARAKNRRVQFIILKQDPSKAVRTR